MDKEFFNRCQHQLTKAEALALGWLGTPGLCRIPTNTFFCDDHQHLYDPLTSRPYPQSTNQEA